MQKCQQFVGCALRKKKKMEEREKIVWYLFLPGKMAGDSKTHGDQAKDK